MSYKSKADRGRERWMTLPEVVEHIRRETDSDEDSAKNQVTAALIDCALGPLKWSDPRRIPEGFNQVTMPDDSPPSRPDDWKNAKIDWQSGKVRDEWNEHKPKHRVLLVSRIRVWEHWPPRQAHPTKKIQGPKTGKREMLAEKMFREIKAGKITAKQLRDLPQKELIARFGLARSRDTAEKARLLALDRHRAAIPKGNSDK